MLGIDISALSLAELRQLLEVARAREQHALVEQITAELRARPGRAARYGSTGTLAFAGLDSGSHRETPSPPRRRRAIVALTAGAAGALTAALAWGVSIPADQLLQRTSATSSAVPPRAALALTAVPVAVDDPLSDPVPDPVVAASRALRNACYEKATPADRLVCGYPSLALRERRLKAVFEAAVSAGADARALEAEQAAWKGTRDDISDREALAELYDRRIRQLAETAGLPPTEAP